MRSIIGITIGLVLSLAGAAVVIVGIGMAVHELIGLYQGAINDPMHEPQGGEKAVSARMIHGVLIGAAGVPFLIIGSVLLKVTLFQRLFGRRAGR
jgi:hypothetical protein